jgi:hypothetical protein
MKREDIIAMARKAGLLAQADINSERIQLLLAGLRIFAALVAAAEREACAKACSDVVPHEDYGVLRGDVLHGHTLGCDDCAATIRARGETK